MNKETDCITEQMIVDAIQMGFNHYPKDETDNPYGDDEPILRDAWLEGWHDALNKPTILKEIGF